jgi:hypothetical protein
MAATTRHTPLIKTILPEMMDTHERMWRSGRL